MKKVGGFIRDCVEKYIPAVAFTVLFLVFVFQVFMRYVMKMPQAWTTEVEQSCFSVAGHAGRVLLPAAQRPRHLHPGL